ncbi:MAG: type II/IV secretion system ATPase subunit, partial [Anaerolineae bacterium]|nr:type II/IV secretion system ATPase subunit [Anaerolineae bacterium]
MAQSILPFNIGPDAPILPLDKLLPMLTPALREACEGSTFLTGYLQRIPINEIGIPEFYVKPPRSLGNSPRRNLIYPIREGLFVHIYPDALGGRDHYISIEPTVVVPIDHLLPQLEEKLVMWAEEIGRTEDKEAKKELLYQLIDSYFTTSKPTNPKAKQDKVLISPAEREAIRYRVLRDKVGLGVLQPLLLDNFIEDISCSGVGHIFIEHKIFRSVESSISFVDHDDVDEFAVWLGEWIKNPVTVRNPLVDAVLPDGSRINIVYGREISKRGSNFTIRKFSGTPTSVLELIEFGSLNYSIASSLSLMLEEG